MIEVLVIISPPYFFPSVSTLKGRRTHRPDKSERVQRTPRPHPCKRLQSFRPRGATSGSFISLELLRERRPRLGYASPVGMSSG